MYSYKKILSFQDFYGVFLVLAVSLSIAILFLILECANKQISEKVDCLASQNMLKKILHWTIKRIWIDVIEAQSKAKKVTTK